MTGPDSRPTVDDGRTRSLGAWRRWRPLLASVVGVTLVTGCLVALAVPPWQSPSSPTGGNGSVDDRIERLHEAGVTGENVSVGIVDVTGFDAAHPALAGRVTEARAFGSGGRLEVGRGSSHGTATARIVARTAPDADLYLATFSSPSGYERAVEWLVRADVDIIVAPVSFYGKPGDGSARVSRVATDATRRRTVFVAAAGNLARSHWTGTDQSNGILQFRDRSRNYLLGERRDVTLWLSWDRAHESADYTLELYRRTETGPRLVARSLPYDGDDVPNERINARLQDGAYFFVVRGPQNATGARVTVMSPTHDFQYARPEGSIAAPATARGVITVGAYNRDQDRVEPFSSRGPTRDGRIGVDVVASDRRVLQNGDQFVGSSAAAPYVGGVAALAIDAGADRSPQTIERLLRRSATDVGRPGVDLATGHGRVHPAAVAAAAREQSEG